MDVTSENFEQVYEQISGLLETAAFVSIDTEFTGLDEGEKNYLSCFDTPENRYQKLIKPAKEYLVVQFGLCLVYKKANGYEVRPYNFYIFPRPSRIVPDTKFSCQSSSLAFISEHGLDFGKVIREGITYLKLSKERCYHDVLLQKHKKQNHNNNVNNKQGKRNQQNDQHHWDAENSSTTPTKTTPTKATPTTKFTVFSAHQAFIDKQIEVIEAFLRSSSADLLTLDQCSPAVRRSLCYMLHNKYEEELFVREEGQEGNERVQVVKLRGQEHRRQLQAECQREEIEELSRLVGFTKIIKLLHRSGKLIVGHNMLVDLLHTLQQFCDDLPEKYTEFKGLLHATFPLLCDTKFIASTPPFHDISNNMNLECLEKDLKKSAKVPALVFETAPGHATSATTSFHNASYDALVTASCFVRMSAYLQLHHKEVTIESFYNKLYLMRLTDVTYMNVQGEDLPLSRDHVFHVQFKADVKRLDLQTLFKPYGQVYLTFLSDTSAYVSLIDKQFATEVKEELCGKRVCGMKVESFMEHLARQEKVEEDVVWMKRKIKKEASSVGAKKKKPCVQSNGNNNAVSLSINNDQIKTPVVNKKKQPDAEAKTKEVTSDLNVLKISGKNKDPMQVKGVTDLEIPDWD